MPRKSLIRTNLYYYHITTRSNHREWFKIPLKQVWQIAVKSINKANSNNPAHIAQLVLMSNHYHLLIRTPGSDIDRFMFWFNKTFSDLLRQQSGQINRMFGSNYKWSLITNQIYLKRVIIYIFQNPLRANIVNNIEDYPYSSLYYQRRGIDIGFPLSEISWDIEGENSLMFDQELEAIRDGLRKTKFSPSRKHRLRTSPQM